MKLSIYFTVQLADFTTISDTVHIKMRTPSRKKAKKLKPQRGPRKQYPEERFKEALDAIKTVTMTVREAAKEFGVPRSTLQDRLNDRHGVKSGRPTTLNQKFVFYLK